VFFKGGALKLSIRFKAAEDRNIIEIQYINIFNNFYNYLKSFIIAGRLIYLIVFQKTCVYA